MNYFSLHLHACKFRPSVKNSNGSFPPMETETDPCMESFTGCYIVLCRTFSTGTEMETDPCMETFPDHYHIHFRDRSLSQFYYILMNGLESISVPVEKPAWYNNPCGNPSLSPSPLVEISDNAN